MPISNEWPRRNSKCDSPQKKVGAVGRTELAFFGDEPIVDAQGILSTWSYAWPRTVTRVWELEDRVRDTTVERIIGEKALDIANIDKAISALGSGKISGLPDAADLLKELQWYKKLRSNDTEEVAVALMEMGFINNTYLSAEEEGTWFFDNVKIFIKRAQDGIAFLSKKCDAQGNPIPLNHSTKSNGGSGDSRCIMEFQDVVPSYERQKFSLNMLLTRKQKQDLRRSIEEDIKEYAMSDASKKGSELQRLCEQYCVSLTHNDLADPAEAAVKCYNAYCAKEMTINGWMNVRNDNNDIVNASGNRVNSKRTEHIVILTIPEIPKKNEVGRALADYISAGKTVPFTCCWT